jgi:hypothetical protein
MRLTSEIWKRVIAGLIGVAFAICYGFWTMLATGGGHVNFIWLLLFIFVEFFGLYFPIMAILSVNLRPLITKVVFGSLVGFNLFASVLMIVDWIGDRSEEVTDFARTLRSNGYETVVICGAIHFLPTIVFAALLIRSIIRGTRESENDGPSPIQLS